MMKCYKCQKEMQMTPVCLACGIIPIAERSFSAREAEITRLRKRLPEEEPLIGADVGLRVLWRGDSFGVITAVEPRQSGGPLVSIRLEDGTEMHGLTVGEWEPAETVKNWECFCDECYFGMWAVRPVGENRWGHCFHVQTKEEAEGLRDLLNGCRIRPMIPGIRRT